MNVLITGGAGFIGSKLALRLSHAGYKVTIVDNLSPQIHGPGAKFSNELHNHVKCVEGDVRDKHLMSTLLSDCDVLVHYAAETGTGQSMYEVSRYCDINVMGTANIFDILVNNRNCLKKIVVASSRAVYGEGMYECSCYGIIQPTERSLLDLTNGNFEPFCPHCNKELSVVTTNESARFLPTSLYGLTKQFQEQMVLMYAKMLSIDAVALRYQNVYGPGQSLFNPYTGILAVFTNLARENKPISIFEDGNESRDFVYIDDVVDATVLCISPMVSGQQSFNVGSGVRTTVKEVAELIVEFFNSTSTLNITGEFRVGDIRHNVADIETIKSFTDFIPKWSFKRGLTEFLTWATNEPIMDNGYKHSINELQSRGLLNTSK